MRSKIIGIELKYLRDIQSEIDRLERYMEGQTRVFSSPCSSCSRVELIKNASDFAAMLVQAAATSYAERFSGRTTLAHFVVFRIEGAGVIARIEYAEKRAKAWAYQSSGECFAVLPIAGENGATITRLKPMTAAQWRASMIGRR